MLYFRYSEARTFILNEYWFLIPTGVICEYFALKYFKSRRKRRRALKQLTQQVEEQKRFQRIAAVAFGVVGLGASLTINRGGNGNLVEFEAKSCGLPEGASFLNNERFIKIIREKGRKKIINGIIYVTGTALCHLVTMYGKYQLAFPVAVGDFGVTSAYQLIRKSIVVLCVTSSVPVWIYAGPTAGGSIATGLVTLALRLAFMNLDELATTVIPQDVNIQDLRPRIEGSTDVVIVNYKPDQITRPDITPKQQCWLPEQALWNEQCKEEASKIAQARHNLSYKDVVNMQDATCLGDIPFSDERDLGIVGAEATKLSMSDRRRAGKHLRGKAVNFLQKFPDPTDINPSETWDVEDCSVPTPNLRGTKIQD